MSKYTTEVRFICESKYREEHGNVDAKIDTILSDVAPKIFDFDFPIFDENYRLVFEKNILRHFYTREIGLETYGLWKLKLEDKLNEIMPYLNKWYRMYVLDFNPMYNFNLSKLHGGKIDRTENKTGSYQNTASNHTDATSNDTRLYSDTPQNGLSDVQEGRYLTNATVDNGVNVANANSSGSGSDTDNRVISDINGYYETVQGLNGKFIGEAWRAFKDGFVNVDKMLFNELEVLFMQLW